MRLALINRIMTFFDQQNIRKQQFAFAPDILIILVTDHTPDVVSVLATCSLTILRRLSSAFSSVS